MTDPGSPSGLPLGVVCQGKQSRSTPLPPTTPASCVPWRWKAKGCGVRFGTKEVLTRLLWASGKWPKQPSAYRARDGKRKTRQLPSRRPWRQPEPKIRGRPMTKAEMGFFMVPAQW